MPRRIFITILFTLAITIVALYLPSAATAQICPETIGSCQADGWTISLKGEPEPDAACGDSYKYTYQVCAPGTGPGSPDPENPVACNTKGLGHINMANGLFVQARMSPLKHLYALRLRMH
jgi:hypothetical protein